MTPRLVIAGFASLLLHGWLIARIPLALPQTAAAQLAPLEARLAPIESGPPAAVIEKAPTPSPLPAGTRSAASRTVINVPPVAAPAPPAAAWNEAEASEEAPLALETPLAEPETAAREMAETPPLKEAEPEPAQVAGKLPKSGRIAYTMYFGADGFTVGRTVQSWEVDAQGYKLGSVSETTGIVELFRAQRHIYLSEGRVTAQGLQPEKFFMSRTRRGRTEAAQALFDWESGTLKLGKVPHQRGAALFPESQDVISFMYQLALAPPQAGRIRLPITNGSRFETYELEVREEEKIETPLGLLRVVPVRQVPRPGDESIAVWLAVEYRYLPVKIRFFDRDGNPVGEQIVDEIRVSDG